MAIITSGPARMVGGAKWYQRVRGAVAIYAPKGAASLAASYTNLVSPGSNDAAPGTAPTFATATGWTFAGAYLTTGIVPAATWTMIVRFSDYSTNGELRYLAGSRTSGASNRFYLGLLSGNQYYGQGEVLNVNTPVTGGVMAIAGQAGYYNGASAGAITAGTAPAYAIYIGALNQSDSLTQAITAKIQAVIIANVTWTAEEVATYTAMVNAL